MFDLRFLHNAVDEGDFTDDVCRGLLDVLAEVESLRTELAVARQTGNDACDILLERHAEEERRLRGALPDAELLKRAAGWMEMIWRNFDAIALHDGKIIPDCLTLRTAAARIRAVQEARGE